MGMKLRKSMLLLACLLFLVVFSLSAWAGSVVTPEGATRTIVSSTRRQSTATTATPTLAGNVTQMTLTGFTITQMWAAYYGNITGVITLMDSNNHTFYNWSLAQPDGEVYASTNGSIDWLRVECYNLSAAAYPTSAGDATAGGTRANYLNLSELEITHLGGNVSDVDGVDETFSAPFSGSFVVANLTINTSTSIKSNAGCSQAYMFVNNNTQSTDFVETILIQDNQLTDQWDATTTPTNMGTTANNELLEDLVWVTLIEKGGQNGFHNKNTNYEMLVPENGHSGDTATTTYYFYLELN